jgi:hypothetical protein
MRQIFFGWVVLIDKFFKIRWYPPYEFPDYYSIKYFLYDKITIKPIVIGRIFLQHIL